MNSQLRIASLLATVVLASCGGGGVKVPDGIVVGFSCTDPAAGTTATARFNAQDAGTDIQLSQNALTACFTTARVSAIRSTTSIAQGTDSFHYFEARRSGFLAIGLGTSAVPLSANSPASDDIYTTDQSIIVRGTSVESSRTTSTNFTVGNVPSDETIGFAIDYRGLHPIVYVLGNADSARTANLAQDYCANLSGTGSACVLARYEMTAVTAPLFVYAFGSNSSGAPATVSINTGEGLAAAPFRFAPARVQEALFSRFFGIGVGLKGYWPGVAGRVIPSVTRVSGRRAVVRVGDSAPYLAAFSATANDATQGDVTASISWVSSSGVALATGASLGFSDGLMSSLGNGTHRIRAIATNSSGGYGSATFELTILPAGDNSDSDGDGLGYDAEKLAGTNPAEADTDGDGLADDVELAGSLGAFNPLVADTDTNGIRDGRQLAGNPTLAESVVMQRQAGSSTLGTSRGLVVTEDGLGVVVGNDLNLDCVLGRGLFVGGNYLGAAYTQTNCRKRAIRASVPIRQGEFRYFETRRLVANAGTAPNEFGPNLGHGLIDATSAIDPYCCLAATLTPDVRTPPSMSLNSANGAYNRLASIGGFPTLSTHYIGFAVDYRGANPTVYFITTRSDGSAELSGRTVITGLAGGDVYPMVYGDPSSDNLPAIRANFGLQRFNYPIQTVRTLLIADGLTANELNTSFQPGVGIHRRPNN